MARVSKPHRFEFEVITKQIHDTDYVIIDNLYIQPGSKLKFIGEVNIRSEVVVSGWAYFPVPLGVGTYGVYKVNQCLLIVNKSSVDNIMSSRLKYIDILDVAEDKVCGFFDENAAREIVRLDDSGAEGEVHLPILKTITKFRLKKGTQIFKRDFLPNIESDCCVGVVIHTRSSKKFLPIEYMVSEDHTMTLILTAKILSKMRKRGDNGWI